jgi:hypothetical protein
MRIRRTRCAGRGFIVAVEADMWSALNRRNRNRPSSRSLAGRDVSPLRLRCPRNVDPGRRLRVDSFREITWDRCAPVDRGPSRLRKVRRFSEVLKLGCRSPLSLACQAFLPRWRHVCARKPPLNFPRFFAGSRVANNFGGVQREGKSTVSRNIL